MATTHILCNLPISWKWWKTFREIMGLQKFNCDFKKTLDPLCDPSLCANQSSLLLLHVVSEFSKASFLSCSLSKLPYTLISLRLGLVLQIKELYAFILIFRLQYIMPGNHVQDLSFKNSIAWKNIWVLFKNVLFWTFCLTIFILFFTIQFAVHTT